MSIESQLSRDLQCKLAYGDNFNSVISQRNEVSNNHKSIVIDLLGIDLF